MLNSFNDFCSPIADDFTEPYAAVDFDKQGAPNQTHGPRVRGNNRVHDFVPELQELRLRDPLFKSEVCEDVWHELGCGQRRGFPRLFKTRPVHSPPRLQRPTPSGVGAHLVAGGPFWHGKTMPPGRGRGNGEHCDCGRSHFATGGESHRPARCRSLGLREHSAKQEQENVAAEQPRTVRPAT